MTIREWCILSNAGQYMHELTVAMTALLRPIQAQSEPNPTMEIGGRQ